MVKIYEKFILNLIYIIIIVNTIIKSIMIVNYNVLFWPQRYLDTWGLPS